MGNLCCTNKINAAQIPPPEVKRESKTSDQERWNQFQFIDGEYPNQIERFFQQYGSQITSLNLLAEKVFHYIHREDSFKLTLEKLRQCSQLKNLTLECSSVRQYADHWKIKGYRGRAISALTDNLLLLIKDLPQQLDSLDFSFCDQLTGNTLLEILRNQTHLTTLKLSYSRGIRSFADVFSSMPNEVRANLQHLHLPCCTLMDADLLEIEKISGLQTLEVSRSYTQECSRIFFERLRKKCTLTILEVDD